VMCVCGMIFDLLTNATSVHLYSNKIILSFINKDNLKREVNIRNTITIKNEVYTRLRNHGRFGESFSILIARILDELEGSEKSS